MCEENYVGKITWKDSWNKHSCSEISNAPRKCRSTLQQRDIQNSTANQNIIGRLLYEVESLHLASNMKEYEECAEMSKVISL